MRRCCLALLLLALPALLRADEAQNAPILVLDTGGHTDEIMSVFFTADGKRLGSVAKDKTVRLWDTSNGDCVGVLHLPVGPTDESGVEAGITAGYAPKKNLLAVSSPGLKKNQFWVYVIDLAANKIVQVCEGITRPVWAVALSPDGERVAAGGVGGQLHIWEVKTGKLVSEAPGYKGLVRALAFSPDGKTLASGSWDKTARLWEVASGKELKTLEGGTEWVVGVAWSPDGKYLAASERNHQVRLWQTDGTRGPILEGNHNGLGIAFAKNPKELVVGAALVDAETGKVLTRLKKPPGGYPVLVALAPDGTQACCASGPEMVLWNTAKKKGVKEAEYRLEGKGHPLARLASISTEGRQAGSTEGRQAGGKESPWPTALCNRTGSSSKNWNSCGRGWQPSNSCSTSRNRRSSARQASSNNPSPTSNSATPSWPASNRSSTPSSTAWDTASPSSMSTGASSSSTRRPRPSSDSEPSTSPPRSGPSSTACIAPTR